MHPVEVSPKRLERRIPQAAVKLLTRCFLKVSKTKQNKTEELFKSQQQIVAAASHLSAAADGERRFIREAAAAQTER